MTITQDIINTRIARLKDVYINGCETYYSEDCEYVHTIDFENGMVYYTKYLEAGCGCCSYPEDYDTELNHFIGFMSDEGFEDMISHYTFFKNKSNGNSK